MPQLPLPPGPSPFSLGNLLRINRDIFGFFEDCARRYGDFFTLRLGPARNLLLLDPALIEYVLGRGNPNFIKPYLLRTTRVLGDGMLSSSGETWRRRRRALQPAFHREVIQGYGRTMVELCDRQLDGWRDGEVRELDGEMRRLTLQLIGKVIFGADVVPGGPMEEISRGFAQVTTHFGKRLKSPLPLPDTFPTPGNLKLQRVVRRMDELLFGLIHARRQEGGGLDILSLLLRSRDEEGVDLTDEQIRNELNTMVIAGHEPNALVLIWTWYLLARDPRVEAALHAELSAVLGTRPPTVEDLPRLRYTEAVVLESLRLYPPVSMFGREAIADCEVGGYRVPAGSTILICCWLLHRDPRSFPDPLAFRPERWLERPQHSRFAFLPFGGGPRRCIGESLAMVEAVLLVARIAQRFRLELLPGWELVPAVELTLHPRDGLPMRLRRREGA